MRRTIPAIIFVALILLSVPAFAAPRFHSSTSSVDSDGALDVSFDERGLGNENVDLLLEADADVTYACFNRGGKNPSATNKRSFQETVTEGESFEAKNGRIIATLEAGPPGPGSFTCPSGQRRELASVSYTNIVLTDTTNDVSTSVPDASRTFFNV